MKHYLMLLLLVTGFHPVRAQLSMIYENSFRNWTTGQGWEIIDSDAIPGTVGVVNKSLTSGTPLTTEIMDYMLGVMGQTGTANLVYMTPPLALEDHPWAQFYSSKNSVNFSVWVVPDANNPTLAGMTDSIASLHANGFNNINLSAYANTTIRLAFRLTGANPTAYIDDLKVFEKQSLAYIPDNAFRSYLQSAIPAAFIGDSLDYTSNVVINYRRILHPNGSIASLEGLQYFPFLKKIDLSGNAISYFPPNRLPYLDTLIVPHNHITLIPDVPVAKYLDYSYNLATNFPDFFNKQCAWLIANNNLIADCLQGTNRFVNGSILNNIATYKGTYTYYNLLFINSAPLFNCSQSTAKVDGVVFYDTNANGVHDPGEIVIPNQAVTFTQGTDMVTNITGHYGVSAEAGQFNIVVNPPTGFSCPPLDTVLQAGDVLHHDFPVTGVNTPAADASVWIAGQQGASLNQNLVLTVGIQNLGNSTAVITGKFPIPSGASFVSSSTGTVIGDTLFWSSSLTPFQGTTNTIAIGIAGLPAGQNFVFPAFAFTTGDGNPANDTDTHVAFIADSVLPISFPANFPTPWGAPYDPNNKLVSTPIVDTNFLDYLYYTINFENIGSGNATYVTVRDKLSGMLDHTSFQYLGSTHPCVVSYALDSIIQFTFDPIVLTPTSLDSLHSKGTIWFRIRPSAPMQVGDTIFNSASIVFNTNAPIITNVSTVHVDPLRDAEFTHLTSTQLCGSDTVWFYDLSNANPLSWEWQFEGAVQPTSTLKYPKAVYTTAGTYDVQLITHWVDGRTDTIVKPDYVVVSPGAQLADLPVFCEDAATYQLAGGLPSGGTYSGANVTAGVFDPVAAGPGQHTVTYTYDDGNGCTTAAAKTITVTPKYDFQSTYQICEGETYSWQGNDYSSAATYTASYTTASGCDSTYTLNLSVNPISAFTENEAICSGETYSWRGTDYTQPGDYTVHFVSQHGCDSAYTLSLIVAPGYAFADNQTICEGTTLSWRGSDYSAAGTYTDSYFAQYGCDSIYTLHLTIAPHYQFTETHTICAGDSYSWHGSAYSAAGTYTADYFSMNGCDSSYTLQLIVTPMDYAEAHTMCDGESYGWQGSVYTTTDTYTAVYTNVNGCDSTYTLELTVNPVSAFSESLTICEGETLSWQGSDYASPGTYTVAYSSMTGCDSTYTLGLTVNDATVTTDDPTITATAENAAYQWLDCDNGYAPIAGQTDRAFTPAVNGNYAVIVTQGGCSDTSECVTISSLGTDALPANGLLIYPNPVSDALTISAPGNDNELYFDIFNATGQLVHSGTLKEEALVPFGSFAPGIYTLRIDRNGGPVFEKIVKQ